YLPGSLSGAAFISMEMSCVAPGSSLRPATWLPCTRNKAVHPLGTDAFNAYIWVSPLPLRSVALKRKGSFVSASRFTSRAVKEEPSLSCRASEANARKVRQLRKKSENKEEDRQEVGV